MPLCDLQCFGGSHSTPAGAQKVGYNVETGPGWKGGGDHVAMGKKLVEPRLSSKFEEFWIRKAGGEFKSTRSFFLVGP